VRSTPPLGQRWSSVAAREPRMTPGAQSERQWRPRGKEGGVNPTFVTVEPISVWKKRRQHELPYRKNLAAADIA
jgi:hypothetical protein